MAARLGTVGGDAPTRIQADVAYTAQPSAFATGQALAARPGSVEEIPAQGLQANVITYNATISACGKSHQWQRTLELLEKRPSQELQANVITYSAIISACGNGKQCQRRAASLERCHKSLPQSAAAQRRRRASLQTCSTRTSPQSVAAERRLRASPQKLQTGTHERRRNALPQSVAAERRRSGSPQRGDEAQDPQRSGTGKQRRRALALLDETKVLCARWIGLQHKNKQQSKQIRIPFWLKFESPDSKPPPHTLVRHYLIIDSIKNLNI